MTLVLNLPVDLEKRLVEAAKREGVPVDAYAMRILGSQTSPADRRAELVSLLQSWIDEDDAGEQKDTGDYLIRALDEDRLSDRKLYPPELKGKTW